jgi:hypothetical protein
MPVSSTATTTGVKVWPASMLQAVGKSASAG